jgi:hypothetical protein
MHSKGPFFFFGAGAREELWGFGFFLVKVKGHIGGPFFLFQQGSVFFFIKKICIENLEKINRKRGKNKFEFTLEKQNFPFFSQFLCQKMAKFFQQKNYCSKAGGKHIMWGYGTIPIFLWGKM